MLDALHRLAADHGRALGAARSAGAGHAEPARVRAASWRRGCWPGTGTSRGPDGERVVLANCPFHTLAQAQTELVCHMNEALVGGVAGTLAPHCPQVTLDPGAAALLRRARGGRGVSRGPGRRAVPLGGGRRRLAGRRPATGTR